MIYLLLFLLFCATSSVAQPSYWFQGFQRQGNAQLAQQYEFVAGPGITFGFDGVHSIISAPGGVGSLQLFGDVTSPLTALPNVTTTLKLTGTAGTYTKVTFDAQGRETSGTAAILDSADFANQGTTTTLLHGNAAGNPSWAKVNLATETTGSLPAGSSDLNTNVWFLNGNTLGNTNQFLGTLDASPLKLQMNNNVMEAIYPNLSVSIGPSNFIATAATGAIAIGTNNNMTGVYGISIGNGYFNGAGNWLSGNQVSGQSSVAIGSANIVAGRNAVSIGNAQTVSGDFSTVIGFSGSTGASNAIAMGRSAAANGVGSFAMGSGAAAANSGSYVWKDAIPTSGPFPNNSDTVSNQFIINARGGAILYSGRNGLLINEKNSIAAATVSALTNGSAWFPRNTATAGSSTSSNGFITVAVGPFTIITNSTLPAETNFAKAWIQVTNAADGSVWKMPLYQ